MKKRLGGLNVLFLACVLVVLAVAPTTKSQAQEAYLVTYGPGLEVWELFGHNAIWIKDSSRDVDHSFSFGYFELTRPGFYRDFARGIMPYYGSAGSTEREFEFYRSRDRDIRVQKLDLSPAQVIQLFNRLHQSIFPQPQYYEYDYYLNNCSTRLRDLLDEITSGALSEQWKNQPAERNFRDHTRALTHHRYFMQIGIQTLLGPDVDRDISVWEEAFLPQRLAEALTEIELDQGPLVIDDRVTFRSDSIGNRFQRVSNWPISLLLGVTSLLVLFVPVWTRRPRLAVWIQIVAGAAVGLAGLTIALMWVASGHEATWRNAMLLVLNPLWLLWPWPWRHRLRRALWLVLLISAVIGTVYLALPLGQFRLDALLWFVPLVVGLLHVSHPGAKRLD